MPSTPANVRPVKFIKATWLSPVDKKLLQLLETDAPLMYVDAVDEFLHYEDAVYVRARLKYMNPDMAPPCIDGMKTIPLVTLVCYPSLLHQCYTRLSSELTNNVNQTLDPTLRKKVETQLALAPTEDEKLYRLLRQRTNIDVVIQGGVVRFLEPVYHGSMVVEVTLVKSLTSEVLHEGKVSLAILAYYPNMWNVIEEKLSATQLANIRNTSSQQVTSRWRKRKEFETTKEK